MTAYFEDLTCCKDLRWTPLCRIKLSALLSILKYNSSVINHLLDSYFICNIYLVKWVTLKVNQNISLLFELYSFYALYCYSSIALSNLSVFTSIFRDSSNTCHKCVKLGNYYFSTCEKFHSNCCSKMHYFSI